MKLFFLFPLLLFLLTACPPAPTEYALLTTEMIESVAASTALPKSTQRYDASLYYPDTNHLDHMPLRQVQVNLHFMNTEDTLYRYNGEEGIEYGKDLIRYANKDLAKNEKSTLMPIGVDVPVLPFRYYLRLVDKPGTNEPAIYFHYDDEEYDYTFSGKNRNIGERGIVNKYGVDIDSTLNIFIMAPPRDSAYSKTFNAEYLTGVFLGNFIKVAGYHPRHRPAWEHRGTINHEVAHALGLHHAWLANDGCDDTRPHDNKCWIKKQSAKCDTMTSNNLMDYSAYQIALTPCQIGRIHARFSDLGSKQRGWLTPLWCTPGNGAGISITETIVWEGARDLNETVTIKAGGRLRINARTHFARTKKIIVEPGGVLELGPLAWLHNACEENWGGIETGSQGKNAGTVVVEAGARIENLAS